jgi:phosphocarrier protein HPr
MPSQVVTVASTVGLHARPAALLIKASSAAGVPVTIGRVGEPAVNAASMLSVLALGAKHGEELEITVGESADAESILASLVEIVATNHDG